MLPWYIPGRVDAGRLGLIQTGDLATRVETDDKVADAEGADATGLSVTLLHAGNVFCDVVDGDGVLN